MTKVMPFRAFVYNQEKIKDLSKVVCPPYDVISTEAQINYHKKDPYNLIHILLGLDISGEDKYKKAANYFRDWLKEKILIQEERPAVYFYIQEYSIKGEKKTRMGFISLLHLDTEDSSVFKHENTRTEAKEDRSKLIKEVKANLSPIFAVFPDKKRIIQRTYQQYIRNLKPFIEVTDEERTIHRLWRLDSEESLKKIQSEMRDEKIFIADGHHRYEVACAFREEMRRKLGNAFTGEEGFNYILTYFTNTDSRGLTILPIHRLAKLDSELNLSKFLASCRQYFDVEEFKDRIKFFFLMAKGGRTEHVLGMYKDNKYWLFRLKNIKILDKLIGDKPKECRSLDVSILNAIILKMILGIDLENKKYLEYSPDTDEFMQQVDNNHLYVVFFLNSVKIEQIISVALAGSKMPPKSTYFYPKVLSGLVINKFNE